MMAELRLSSVGVRLEVRGLRRDVMGAKVLKDVEGREREVV